jgi:hypothetical protein
MVFLISVFLHPLDTINLWLEDDPEASGREVAYLMSVFLAVGIWLVFDRYQKIVNSAVPFVFRAPDVGQILKQS